MNTVLWVSNPSPTLQSAAEDAVTYLRQILLPPVHLIESEEQPDADMLIAAGSSALSLHAPEPDRERELVISIQKNEVLIHGQDDIAVRNGLYRFLEECGILFGLQHDELPEPAETLALRDGVIRESPHLTNWGPHVHLNFTMDVSAFSREQWARYLDGCVRLRFNSLEYHFYQGFPWYDVPMRDFVDQTGYYYYGWRHPVPEEPRFKKVIHNHTWFLPPEAEHLHEDLPALRVWAQETMAWVMEEAHQRGLRNQVTFEAWGYDPPESYRQKMTEWNGQVPVERANRFHPLLQEYVQSSLRWIIEHYPDLDGLTIMTGEMAQAGGSEEEVKKSVLDLLDGRLETEQGEAVSWPPYPFLINVMADTLQVWKSAYNAIQKGREEKWLPEFLQMGIGAYTGFSEVLPSIYPLFSRIVPDRSISFFAWPVHGMHKTAKVLEEIMDPTWFEGRHWEVFGWLEFDGGMYHTQSCLDGIHRLNNVASKVQLQGHYAIHWRIAASFNEMIYFARSQWKPSLTPDDFWKTVSTTLGDEAAHAMQQGFMHIEKATSTYQMELGFCAYPLWHGLKWEEKNEYQISADSDEKAKRINAGPPSHRLGLKKAYEAALSMFEIAANSGTRPGRSLASYFANKIECSLLQLEYWRIWAEAEALDQGYSHTHRPDEEREKEFLVVVRELLLCSEKYLSTFQSEMRDRTDEGVLVSYYNTAYRFAYRYLYSREKPEEGKFYHGPPKKLEPAESTDTTILAPQAMTIEDARFQS